MNNKKAIVIGAGVSGLSAAIKLKEKGFDVTVLEKEAQVGGVMTTHRENGFKAESGSNSIMVQSQTTLDFLEKVGAGEYIEKSKPEAKKRFFVRNGKPRAVPMSPISLLLTPLFTLAGKIRLLREPFIKPIDKEDPSVAEFTKYRFGQDVLDYAINPMMAGIYGGDPNKLSIKHAFAPFWNLEKKYGSVIKGAIKSMKEKKASGNIFKPLMISFKEGMATLPRILAENLKGSVKCNAEIISIDFSDDGWLVQWVAGDEEVYDNYDALVIATPAPDIAKLPLSGTLSSALNPLKRIKYAPVATYTLGFKKNQIKHKLDGFGALVPEKENMNILGSLFVSTLFDNKAPADCITLTNYVGGMRNPKNATLPQEEMDVLVMKDLRQLLGVTGEPIFRKLYVWENAIAQYNVGYGDYLDIIDNIEKQYPYLSLVGAYRGGVGVSSCIENGLKYATKLADRV